MPKKRDRKEFEDPAPASNPFSALKALRDQLPEGDLPAPEPESGGSRAASGSSPGARLSPGPEDSPVVVARERKGRGGKTVTRVSGLRASAQDLASLAKDMRKALGTGTSIEGSDILAQGAQEDRVLAWLEGRGVRRLVRGT